MEKVSRSRVLIYERVEDHSIYIYYRRKAPWGEECQCGQRIDLLEIDRTPKGVMREQMLRMAHEAGRMLDRMIEKKQSDRIKKRLDAPRRSGMTWKDVMDERASRSPLDGLIDPLVDPSIHREPTPFPRIPPKEPAKKTPVTDATITRLKESRTMDDDFDPSDFDDLIDPLETGPVAPPSKAAKTASEKYDALKLALADANSELMVSEVGMTHECQVWSKAFYDDFTTGQLISEEEYTFDRLIYSEKLDRVVALLRPETGGRGFAVVPELMEDAFPVLSLNIDSAIVKVSEFESLKNLDWSVRKLTKGRDAFRRAMSEASHSAMGAAVAAKEAVKKEVEGSFYEAQPLYGML